ncbi:MAG: zinc ribbon domain-containing protein [Anaerolineaceae bacterium]|nr:zinc ribbon domain-containing protein [Anaerolineaceae bacterium]
MQNYYELLQVPLTASASEIEEKLDDQYQKWRALVTHHDNNIVMQANQALQSIEQMRSTLLHPASRSNYDADLDKELANSAGLTDPNFAIAPPVMPQGGIPTIGTRATVPDEKRIDRWICTNPNCRQPNPLITAFCSKCGEEIGKSCPKCSALVEKANQFCSKCGVDKLKYVQDKKKKNIKALEKTLAEKEEEIQLASSNPTKFFNTRNSLFDVGYKPDTTLGQVVSIGLAIFLGLKLRSWWFFGIGFIVGLVIYVSITQMILTAKAKKAVQNHLQNRLLPDKEKIIGLLNAARKEKYE